MLVPEPGREMLLDKEQMLAFIEASSKRVRERSGHFDPEYDSFYRFTLQTARDNIASVFQFSESPIETLFLNSLVVGFWMSDPTNLRILPPPTDDIVKNVRNRRSYLAGCQRWYWMFEQLANTVDLDGFHLFLQDRVPEQAFTEEVAEDIYRMVLAMQATRLQRAFHLVMQAPFHDIKVNGRSVRTDAYFWVPSDPSFSLIVECDGYRFHSNQASFDADRRRDRAFAVAGYRVLRFSGREICDDPISKSRELFDYLQMHSKLHAPPQEVRISQDFKDALRTNIEDFRRCYSPGRYQKTKNS